MIKTQKNTSKKRPEAEFVEVPFDTLGFNDETFTINGTGYKMVRVSSSSARVVSGPDQKKIGQVHSIPNNTIVKKLVKQ